MAFPLANIRVLDLTRLLPGGICTLMLADQGAEVIKIEQPITGDYARWYVPRVGEYAAVFHAMNRNKLSVVLDLKQAEGIAVLHELAQTADVLIESFRPQVAQKMGLGYDTLKTVNPRLVVCSLSGFGQTGEMAEVAGHDLNFAAITGVLAAGSEQVLPIQAMDFGGAFMAAFAISTALYQREKTGEGAYIDAALLDSGLSLMTLARAETFARGAAPAPAGEVLTGGYACYRVYRTADDRAIALAALEPKFWQTFCLLAGREDLAKASYLDPDEQPQLIQTLATLFASRSHADWMALLADSETCASDVLTVEQAAHHPQIQARGAWYESEGIAHTRTPFHLGETVPHCPAPALGADTFDILQKIGYNEVELGKLQAQGILG